MTVPARCSQPLSLNAAAASRASQGDGHPETSPHAFPDEPNVQRVTRNDFAGRPSGLKLGNASGGSARRAGYRTLSEIMNSFDDSMPSEKAWA